MVRTLLCFLLGGSLFLRGSDAIPMAGGPPQDFFNVNGRSHLTDFMGVTPPVRQPHVTANMILEKHPLSAGESFGVILHLHMDTGWHTYWINPGDAGLATTIKWTLPAGFSASPIQWPTPEIHKMGPLTTYGYGGDVYLLTTIKTETETKSATLNAHVEWLVCQEECIPGKADFQLAISLRGDHREAIADKSMPYHRTDLFVAARARLPVPNTRWKTVATYSGNILTLRGGQTVQPGSHPYFFPEQQNVLAANEDPGKLQPAAGGGFSWPLELQQNGQKPDQLSGVLTSDQPLQPDGAKAVYIPSISVYSVAAGEAIAAPVSTAGSAAITNGSPAMAPYKSSSEGTLKVGTYLAPSAQPWLIAVLGAAFVGGLILNLMPCVLPVLSLKVFSLLRHAGENPRGAWKQGAAFTVGVVISFWILAGLLIALRAAGNHLGWGFQMQSPGFVLALIFLFFLLGLNLFGVFELGTSLVGLDAKASGHAGGGLASSFLNGVLATIAATPCTAPFMGSSVGFAAEQPPSVALLIFTVLALGMATPYLLLTIFPGAMRFVPKPGAWMEAFKQFMGFLLLATVIFLVYVFGALVGQDQIPGLLAALLLAGIAAWVYGKWGNPLGSVVVRTAAIIVAILLLAYAVSWGAILARATPPPPGAVAASGPWQPWTSAAVNQALAQKRPVFVDFTAAWCLSCKVNEQVALETDAVRRAFAQKNVALFRADWTHSDPKISEILEQYHRDGVPLYLLYAPGGETSPQVLPEVLTPGIVLNALSRLP